MKISMTKLMLNNLKVNHREESVEDQWLQSNVGIVYCDNKDLTDECVRVNMFMTYNPIASLGGGGGGKCCNCFTWCFLVPLCLVLLV